MLFNNLDHVVDGSLREKKFFRFPVLYIFLQVIGGSFPETIEILHQISGIGNPHSWHIREIMIHTLRLVMITLSDPVCLSAGS